MSEPLSRTEADKGDVVASGRGSLFLKEDKVVLPGLRPASLSEPEESDELESSKMRLSGDEVEAVRVQFRTACCGGRDDLAVPVRARWRSTAARFWRCRATRASRRSRDDMGASRRPLPLLPWNGMGAKRSEAVPV